MAKYKFAVSGQFLDLLTPTRGISDGLYVNSFEFTFRSPEWDTCVEKWAHFYNSEYNKIGANGEAVPYDFNLVDNQITADRGVNLPAGIWEVFLHGSVLVNGEVVQRYVTESQSIQIIQSGVINAEPLASLQPSVAEQLSALVSQVYNARITSAGATIDNGFGTPEVDVSLVGDPAYKRITFDFHNLKGNGIDSLVFTETGENRGLLTITLTTGEKIVFDDIREALAAFDDIESHAAEAAEIAEESSLIAEGYAVGKQDGADVPSTSPYYHNNSKFFSDQALNVSEQIVKVQDVQPTEPYNKVWIKESDIDTIVVPTLEEYDELIMVSDTEPTSELNKIWVDEEATTVQVPTYAEFEALANDVNTSHSGVVFTTSTLPSDAGDGATCWCSDIKMTVTYYDGDWYKPDGTALT